MDVKEQLVIYLSILLILYLIYDFYRCWREYKKNRQMCYDKHEIFVKHLNDALQRHQVYSSNVKTGEKKYTEIGVLEKINEVRKARGNLLIICGKHLKSVLENEGTKWLDDADSFGNMASIIREKVERAVLKDKN